MKRLVTFILLSFSVLVIYFTSCTHKPPTAAPTVADGNYPSNVAAIIVTKCASAGCHNQASYTNAAGLLLDTWEHLFQGSIYGAAVVPYSTQYSPLLYYTNTDSTLGIVVTKPGHLDVPISRNEYLILRNWIAAGAPDKNGNIPFATNPSTRQKIYVTIQGCNLVAVIDAQSRQVMRYIPVGDAISKSPHDIEAAADGMSAYIPFFNGNYVQKLDLSADTVIGGVNLAGVAPGGAGLWSKIFISPADTAFLVSGWIANGCVVAVNAATMQRNPRRSVDAGTGGTSLFPYPHGLTANATFDTFYATLQSSIIKYTFFNSGGLSYHKLIPATGSPHQLRMTPDHSKYFVTCPSATTNELRVYDRHTDTLIKAIPMGADPLEMDIAPSKNYLFVTCMEDAANPQVNRRGSVYVINYNTLDVVKIIYGDFYQPHDIAVDEQNGLIFIPSRNADPTGPAPHHATTCVGRPGWYSVYDLNTLEPADNKRYDLPVDPYGATTRFR